MLLGFENPLARQHFNCSGARTSELWLTLRIYLFSYLLRPLAHTNTHSQTHNGAINELEWQQEAGGRRQRVVADKDLKDLLLSERPEQSNR